MAVAPQPAALRLELGQDLADQAPERALVVSFAQMAELVHDHVLEHRGRRRRSGASSRLTLPLALRPAPQVFLLLDPHQAAGSKVDSAVRGPRACSRASRLGRPP